MTSSSPKQLRYEAEQLRATAARLEAMAVALEAEQATADTFGYVSGEAALDHPDLRPRGLAAVGGGRR